MAYNSAFNLESLVTPIKAATVYSAHETSLFLGGNMIPSVAVPAGHASLQVPLLGSTVATKITAEGVTDDIPSTAVTDTKVSIPVDIYAARTTLRDLGGIDPQEVGRTLGNAVSAKFDADAILALEDAGITNAVDTGGTVTLNFIFDAIKLIRESGETGQLMAVVDPAMATNLMKNIGTQAYAGGAFQDTAMANGFVGQIAGVNMFMSSYMTANSGTVFSADAFRMGIQRNIELEVQRRAEAVGNSLVANLHAGVGLVDAARACRLYDVA